MPPSYYLKFDTPGVSNYDSDSWKGGPPARVVEQRRQVVLLFVRGAIVSHRRSPSPPSHPSRDRTDFFISDQMIKPREKKGQKKSIVNLVGARV